MDFSTYTTKLQSDQRRKQKILQTTNHQQQNYRHHPRVPYLSSHTRSTQYYQAKQEQYHQRQRQTQVQTHKLSILTNHYKRLEYEFGVKEIGPNDRSLQLTATTIHGFGDKVTLPASVLSTLTIHDLLPKNQQPLFFRLGIRREGYVFPSSALKSVMETIDVTMDDDWSLEDEEELDETIHQMYRDEVSQQYVSYVYASVLEFTEEEGFVGMPKDFADRLLSPRHESMLKGRITVDPAKVDTVAVPTPTDLKEIHTPGHPAYKLFSVPISPIEVSLFQYLPKGTYIRVIPSEQAIRNGFHTLPDMKHILEQSLLRTRASVTLNDTVMVWFRGREFRLQVTKVMPGEVGAVSLIDTDVEVEIETSQEETSTKKKENENNLKDKVVESHNHSTTKHFTGTNMTNSPTNIPIESDTTVPPEPSADRTDHILTVQIRAKDGRTSQPRRFDTRVCSVAQLCAFACVQGMVRSGGNLDDGNNDVESLKFPFKLTTRFPRRVLECINGKGSKSLEEMGLGNHGQELLFVED